MVEKNDFAEVIDLDEDHFIDGENMQFHSNKDSYEMILIQQIQNCVKVLTMDKKSCYDKIKSKGGYELMIVKDLDELIIRNVDTLRVLMNKHLQRNPNFKDEVQRIINEDKQFEIDYNNKDIVYQGIGKTKIGLLLLDSEHPLRRSLMTYHSKRYREMFEVLMQCFNKYKEQQYEDTID